MVKGRVAVHAAVEGVTGAEMPGRVPTEYVNLVPELILRDSKCYFTFAGVTRPWLSGRLPNGKPLPTLIRNDSSPNPQSSIVNPHPPPRCKDNRSPYEQQHGFLFLVLFLVRFHHTTPAIPPPRPKEVGQPLLRTNGWHRDDPGSQR